MPVILGAGAEMKSNFLPFEERWFSEQYLGDMKQRRTVSCYSRALSHFLSLYDHPGIAGPLTCIRSFLSTAAARKNWPVSMEETVAIQASPHLAACLMENGSSGPAIGVIFDGTGFGSDGTIWGGLPRRRGGELYSGRALSSRLPGGDASGPRAAAVCSFHALRNPWDRRCRNSVSPYGPEGAE